MLLGAALLATLLAGETGVCRAGEDLSWRARHEWDLVTPLPEPALLFCRTARHVLRVVQISYETTSGSLCTFTAGDELPVCLPVMTREDSP